MSTEDMPTPFEICHCSCTNNFPYFKQGIVMNETFNLNKKYSRLK